VCSWCNIPGSVVRNQTVFVARTTTVVSFVIVHARECLSFRPSCCARVRRRPMAGWAAVVAASDVCELRAGRPSCSLAQFARLSPSAACACCLGLFTTHSLDAEMKRVLVAHRQCYDKVRQTT